MKVSRRPRLLVFLATALFAVGIWKGWRSGGPDFRVFWSAARTALDGHASVLYSEGPDRFLYAPGFAWLLSPLALLPYETAHAIWLAACALAYLGFARLFARRLGDLGPPAVAVATLFLMRPIWIDLRYGQVNLLILAASVWALSMAVPAKGGSAAGPSAKFLAWFVFSLAAFAKLYPLPLFLVPIFGILSASAGRKVDWAPVFLGAVAGFLLLAALPAFLSGLPQGQLYSDWIRALFAKGFPLETHNQSVLAALHRFLSGEVIRSHQTGGDPMTLFPRLLPEPAISTLHGMAVIAILALFVRATGAFVRSGSAVALGLLLALCFLPSHLVWKPYFLLGVPLVATLFALISDDPDPYRKRLASLAYFALFAVSHLSSREVLGAQASAWFEAFSGFLAVHLALIALALFGGFPETPRRHVTKVISMRRREKK